MVTLAHHNGRKPRCMPLQILKQCVVTFIGQGLIAHDQMRHPLLTHALGRFHIGGLLTHQTQAFADISHLPIKTVIRRYQQYLMACDKV